MENRMKEYIDDFLKKNEEIAKKIKDLSKHYCISDFVKVQDTCKEYFETGKESEIKGLYGCIYQERDKYLRLDVESPERRLTEEYLEFLHYLLTDKEVTDKVFYIVAYHYLSLGKHMGFQLSEANNAPFPVKNEKELFPLGKTNMKKLEDVTEGRLFSIVGYFSDSDILYYHNMYSEFGYHHHATKNFSLLAKLDEFHLVVNKYDFGYRVRDSIDLFVFRYKAIFTTDRLSTYMFGEVKEKIINNLVDLSENIGF